MMRIKLNASVLELDKEIVLMGKRNYKLNGTLEPDVIAFLSRLETGLSKDELNVFLKKERNRVVFEELKSTALINLVDTRWKGTAMEKSYDFLNFHFGNGERPFQFREDIHIALLGCGGTGANIAMCLASSGIASMTLIDFDTVQTSNLNRQFAYDLNDVGQSKVSCLKTKLKNINPDMHITTVEQQIQSSQDIECLSKGIDLVVSAIDTPAIKSSMYVIEYCIKNNKPVIFGAAGYTSLSAGPLLTTDAAKRDFLASLKKHDKAKSKPISGSIGSTNLLLSAIMANNITSFFYPFSDPELINVKKIYDPLSMAALGEIFYGDHTG